MMQSEHWMALALAFTITNLAFGAVTVTLLIQSFPHTSATTWALLLAMFVLEIAGSQALKKAGF